MVKPGSARFIAALPLMACPMVWGTTDNDAQALRIELQDLRQSYETRIADLEARLAQLENRRDAVPPAANSGQKINGNEFNPSIGLILNGEYATFSRDRSELTGFAVDEEGQRGRESFSAGESELNLSANIDDKFYGSLTAALVREDGEDIVELEEAYVQTLPGAGLPFGASLKFGRALWTLGYLNEHHPHADDFADRPLPYRTFLNNAFNDDGIEFSYVMPTDLYAEIGAGLFRGDDFPFGGARGNDAGAWSAFGRIGGDIGDNQSWRVGSYILSGKTDDGRETNDDSVVFVGDTDLYVADLRYTWAPTGNPRARELTIQGEYFRRSENGSYEDFDAVTGPISVDGHSDGWYLQSVYKFHPQWRIGFRYSELQAPSIPAGFRGSVLDAEGHDPIAWAFMADWANSEFSRIRLQFNREVLSNGEDDNQLVLQYIMSLGAHGAHTF